ECGMVYTAAHAPSAYAADPDYNQSLRGWETTDTISAYVNYVNYVVGSLTGVKYWITFNEPMSTAILTGYLASVFPPGFLGDGSRALVAIQNIVATHAHSI